MLIVTPIVGFIKCSMFCCALLYDQSSFAIILLFVFPVSRDCCVALPYDATGLSAVCVVVFPDYTHILFSNGDHSLVSGQI